MNTQDVSQPEVPISESTQQAQLRQNNEVARVETIHNVRLVSLNTAKSKFQPHKADLKSIKESPSNVFDSFDEFCK